jgi:chemotaxis protein methyltransferase CheR
MPCVPRCTGEKVDSRGREQLSIESSLLQRFIRLIASQTGLQMREEGMDKLRHAIHNRMAQQRLLSPEAYYQLLAVDTATSRQEWQELILPLTIGESYFFRDSGQFSLLRHHILPELIERNRSTRSLRLWSAGCSTGEEPYSLAILVHELLPCQDDWNVVILGTDINKEAVATARSGIYRQHSLRTLDHGLRQRYFHQHRSDWELDGRIRSMVSFRQLNLLKDGFPDSAANLSAIDLILCRNVFIYFDRSAVSQVITKFTQTLQVGGYLVTGHAELHDQNPSGLCLKAFPESAIYQRQNAHTQTLKPKIPQTAQSDVVLPASQPISSFGRVPNKPITVAPARSPRDPLVETSGVASSSVGNHTGQVPSFSAEDLYCQAHGYADVGNYEAARHYCGLALAKDSLAEKPYYLLAQIAEAQGDIAAAKSFLKKILYLSPAAITALLELGALYAREQDLPRARKMLSLALEHLNTLPADTIIEPFMDLPAAQLLPEVQRRIEQLGVTLQEAS